MAPFQFNIDRPSINWPTCSSNLNTRIFQCSVFNQSRIWIEMSINWTWSDFFFRVTFHVSKRSNERFHHVKQNKMEFLTFSSSIIKWISCWMLSEATSNEVLCSFVCWKESNFLMTLFSYLIMRNERWQFVKCSWQLPTARVSMLLNTFKWTN